MRWRRHETSEANRRRRAAQLRSVTADSRRRKEKRGDTAFYSATVRGKVPAVSNLRDVGRRVGELRTARGYSQAELAERVGLSLRMMQSIEAGDNTSVARLLDLAKALNVSAGAFFEPPTSRAKKRAGRPARQRG